MKVVAVGFKVAVENSVYYRKIDYPDAQFFPDEDAATRLGELLKQAREKGAEFVSVRFIP